MSYARIVIGVLLYSLFLSPSTARDLGQWGNVDPEIQALKRIPIPNGTRINIPNHKLNKDSNPTGRAIVFLSSGGDVYCFISGGSS